MIFSIDGINPEPWTSPDVGVGRKGGKVFPKVYKTATLRAYQESIADALSDIDGPIVPANTPLRLDFFFWRQLPDYEIGDGRKSRRHIADATNLQKALEDALQGILFKNDRDVLIVTSTVVEQDQDTKPGIVIYLDTLAGPPIVPMQIAHERAEMLERYDEPSRDDDSRAHIDVEDLF